MTTYNASTVSNTAIASGKPVTLQQGRALRDNPLAQAEGATGAPYVQAAWHPYNGVTIGDGNDGLFYDHAVHGSVSSVETPAFADGYEYRLIYDSLSHNSGTSQTLQIELYQDVAGAYTAAYSICTTSRSAAQKMPGYSEIYRPRILLAKVVIYSVVPKPDGGGLFNSADIGAIAFELTGSNKYSKARLSFGGAGAPIDGGKIYMQKRLCYA